MNNILDENGNKIPCFNDNIKKAVKIFAENIVVQEVDKILEEKKVSGITITLDLQAGNAAQYSLEINKFVADNDSVIGIVEDKYE